MKNPAVDAYIERAADFARPILKRIRKLYHQACPKIEETIKWGFPHFEHQGIVGNMAAFKQHCSFGFWKGMSVPGMKELFEQMGDSEMAGRKVASLEDLPDDDTLLELIRAAVAYNEAGPAAGKKSASKPRTAKPPVDVPADLLAALKTNKRARETFDAFSPSQRREYVEWITEAKREETRQTRLSTTIEWLAEGKTRNWKYERKR